MKKLLCLYFVISVTAWAAKTEDEYWEPIGYKLSKLSSLSEASCYASADDLFACANALNQMLKFETDTRIFVPEARRTSDAEFGKAIESFGPISLVEPKKNKGTSAAEALKFTRQERKAVAQSWRDLYGDTKADKIDFAAVLAWFEKRPYFKQRESAIVAAGINGVLHVTQDPHTSIFPKEYWDEINKVGGSDIVGVGAVLQKMDKNGKIYIAITRTIEDGPAFKAGILAGDLISKIDGNDVVGKSLEEVGSLIRGKEGVTVKIDVERGTVTKTFSIVRAKITIKNVTYKLMGKSSNVGYIKLNSFIEYDASGASTPCREVKAAIKSLTSSGAKSLVFDLRDNGGGLLTESYCISNVFLDLKKDEPIVFTKDLDAAELVKRYPTGAPESVTTNLPMVLLIDSGSASASEIVAGALQDYQRAFLIGDRTWGKGSVQRVRSFGGTFSKVLIKETLSRFYMPSGRTNQIVGISPDVEVFSNPNPTEDDKTTMREEDLYSALPAKGKAWSQPRASTMTKLTDCVAKSGEAEKEFVASSKTTVPFDYQQAYAVDAASCIVAEKLWASTDKRPTFPKDLVTTTLQAVPAMLQQLQQEFNWR